MDTLFDLVKVLLDNKVWFEHSYSDGTSSYDIDYFDGNEYHKIWTKGLESSNVDLIIYFPDDNSIDLFDVNNKFIKSIEVKDLKKYLGL